MNRSSFVVSTKAILNQCPFHIFKENTDYGRFIVDLDYEKFLTNPNYKAQ